MEVEKELAGSLRKVRIKLIIIGICLIFLGILSLLEKGKDNSSQKKFDQYTTSFFKENASANEISLHYLLEHPESYGLKRSKRLYPDMEKESLENETNSILKEIKQLKKFKKEELSKKQQNTYDVLMDYLVRQKNLSKYPYYERIFGKSSGQQVQILLTLSEYRLKNEKDIKMYFKLLNGLDQYFESLIEYSREQIKRNLFISDESLNETLKQIQSVIKQKENNMLVATFNLRLADIKGINAAKKREYCKQNKKLVKTKVIPAYERLYSHLEVLKGNGKNNNGLFYYKNGKEYYEALAAQKTGSDKTVKKMIAISDESIEKCLRKLIKLQKKYPNIINRYRKSKKNIKIVQNSQKILNKLQQKMVKYYPTAPKVSCKIKYVHKTMEEYTSPAFYMVPAIDSYKDNVIYVNQAQTTELYPTLAHEGYPGHLYQNVYYAAKDDDPVRYILDYPGYSEGYATYVESFSYKMMDAEGYGDIYQQMNMEMYEYNLALCSRVDFGVHYEGWKKKDVRVYLRSFGMEKSQADELFQMIIENPANYLSYYIGYQEFCELLTDYKNKAGKHYNLKAYHTEILDAGPCSFDILRRRIESNL